MKKLWNRYWNAVLMNGNTRLNINKTWTHILNHSLQTSNVPEQVTNASVAAKC